jgi:hypothetical protein
VPKLVHEHHDAKDNKEGNGRDDGKRHIGLLR